MYVVMPRTFKMQSLPIHSYEVVDANAGPLGKVVAVCKSEEMAHRIAAMFNDDASGETQRRLTTERNHATLEAALFRKGRDMALAEAARLRDQLFEAREQRDDARVEVRLISDARLEQYEQHRAKVTTLIQERDEARETAIANGREAERARTELAGLREQCRVKSADILKLAAKLTSLRQYFDQAGEKLIAIRKVLDT